MTISVRAEAARAVARVLGGRSLDDALTSVRAPPVRDQGLLRALAYGVLRDRRLLEALAAAMMERPVADREVHALLLVGLFQLRSLRVPPHAAVQETVEAVHALKRPLARALVNAVLRRYTRESAELEAALPAEPAVRTSHPDWLVAALQQDWPQHWQALLEANNQPGPMTLRVNRRRAKAPEYVARLASTGLAARLVPAAPDAVVLEQPLGVAEVPGFTQGSVSVQDASAQLAFDLLEPAQGARVLDACAAPGGKTAHLLERLGSLQVTALDIDRARMVRIEETLHRLNLRGKAAIVAADAAEPARWWDGVPFDRILVDAPCSGTGVIRRHPDIKWLRRGSDIPVMAAAQRRLLDGLWPLLAPGGVLVYGVCSTLRAEGADVVGGFLAAHADARELPIAAEWGEAEAHGRRIAPGGDFDGFYWARLAKA